MQDDDQWWAALPPERKRSIRRWLDRNDEEALRRAAAENPDQLTLPLVEIPQLCEPRGTRFTLGAWEDGEVPE